MDIALEESTGDLDLTSGGLVLNSELEAVRQYLTAKLRAFQGEWFLDEDVGIPYLTQVLRKNPNPVVLDSIFKKAILETPGVIELLDFGLELDSAARILVIRFKARTKTGEIDFNERVAV